MSNQTVVFIPVRGGSKSIPLKNIRPLAGKPLVCWSVEAALGCAAIDQVVVATDSPEIRQTLDQFSPNPRFELLGRSPEVSTDTASTESVMLEFARQRDFQTILLLQATSPLTRSEDLLAGLERYQQGDVDSVLSVVRQKRFIWQATQQGGFAPWNYDYRNRPRRQEFSGYLVENGAFYITSRAALLATECRLSGRVGVVEMAPETYLEIDEPDDWPIVEHLLRERGTASTTSAPASIRMIVSDVDGVLTDAGMYYSEQGDELKKFNTRDGKGFELARRAGLLTALITSENTALVARRAEKLQLDFVRQGITNKLECLKELLQTTGCRLEEVCFVGDDINDLEVLRSVGWACCPNNAEPVVQQSVDYVCSRKGGEGCVREVIEACLAGRRETTQP